MLQTVLRIPHQANGWPVFGFGWALALWALAVMTLGLVAVLRPQSRRDIIALAPTLAVIGAAIIWVLPFLEERGPGGEPLGLPIRGYGVMLLAGVVCGVGLSLYRGRHMGVDPDRVLALCAWMFVAGIVGARLFHVVQYWHTFRDPDSIARSLLNALKFNEGGLVVYGSLIGGLAAAIAFCRREGWSLARTGDLVAPGMVLGLALGRVGCLLNGCCHGGVCHDDHFAVRFPQATHPYMKQLETGELLGLRIASDAQGLVVAEVTDPRGAGAARGVEAGDRVLAVPGERDLKFSRLVEDGQEMLVIQRNAGGLVTWTAAELPRRSLRTHPAQIYSAFNAAMLCALLLLWHPYRRRDGELFLLMLTVYPVTRFLLERVRTDEPGRFGTSLTISQWLSIGLLATAGALWLLLLSRPKNAVDSSRTSPPGASPGTDSSRA